MKWDGNHRVKVIVPGFLQDELCGLCGNYNGIKTDDWITGSTCEHVEGQLVLNRIASAKKYLKMLSA